MKEKLECLNKDIPLKDRKKMALMESTGDPEVAVCDFQHVKWTPQMSLQSLRMKSTKDEKSETQSKATYSFLRPKQNSALRHSHSQAKSLPPTKFPDLDILSSTGQGPSKTAKSLKFGRKASQPFSKQLNPCRSQPAPRRHNSATMKIFNEIISQKSTKLMELAKENNLYEPGLPGLSKEEWPEKSEDCGSVRTDFVRTAGQNEILLSRFGRYGQQKHRKHHLEQETLHRGHKSLGLGSMSNSKNIKLTNKSTFKISSTNRTTLAHDNSSIIAPSHHSKNRSLGAEILLQQGTSPDFTPLKRKNQISSQIEKIDQIDTAKNGGYLQLENLEDNQVEA